MKKNIIEKMWKEKFDRFNKKRVFMLIEAKKLCDLDGVMTDSDYELDEMEEEIRDNGILCPIIVAGPFEDGHFIILDGARRIKALRKIIPNHLVPCYVVCDKDTPKGELRLLSLAINGSKRPDGVEVKMQYAEMLKKQHAEGIYKKRELGKALSELTGVTARCGREYITLAEKGSDGLKESVLMHEVTVHDAAKISELPTKTQEEVIAEYKNLPNYERKEFVRCVTEESQELEDAKEEAKLASLRKKLNKSKGILEELCDENELPTKELEEFLEVCDKFVALYR